MAAQLLHKERWGEEAGAICLVGCKKGYRTATSLGPAYLVYECQNITLQVGTTGAKSGHFLPPQPPRALPSPHPQLLTAAAAAAAPPARPGQ